MTKALVETKSFRLELPEGGLRLDLGGMLKQVEVAYEAYGTLASDRSNVIYVCHALTGDAHAAFYHSEEDTQPGWWDSLIGPGKALDTDTFYVICSNILGGCKGTTGPGSIDPDTGRPYGVNFPHITIQDVVRVEKMLLEQLGITEIYCAIGSSMGGMRALEWSVRYPDYVRRCICISSAVSLSPQALAFDIIGRQEIETDDQWHGGDYYGRPEKPDKGLSLARQLGHITYLSSELMLQKFGREMHDRPPPADGEKFTTNFQIESYLRYQGWKFVNRFDANSYLYISRMMDLYDLEEEFGDKERIFEDVSADFLIVSVRSDWLFPPSQQLDIVKALLANRKRVSYFQIDSTFGHDAFLLEIDTLTQGIRAFLNGKTPQPSYESKSLPDLDIISRKIHEQNHVLDVGSGDGSLMLALQRRKGITGICLDLNFEKIAACMAKGLPAIQIDADTGLGIIPENAFDCILLNQTIQQLHSAIQTVRQMLRIAKNCVIGFPNFAYYAYRWSLGCLGRLPVSETLPFQWYNTPNIHLATLIDFHELCRENNIEVEAIEYISDSAIGKFFISLGLPNLGAERVLTRISAAD